MVSYTPADDFSSHSRSTSTGSQNTRRSRAADSSWLSSLSKSIGKRTDDSGFLSDEDEDADFSIFSHRTSSDAVLSEVGQSIEAGMAHKDSLRLQKEPYRSYHYQNPENEGDGIWSDWGRMQLSSKTFWTLALVFVGMIVTGAALLATGNDLPGNSDPVINQVQTDNIFDREVGDPTLVNPPPNQSQQPKKEQAPSESPSTTPSTTPSTAPTLAFEYTEPLTARMRVLQALLATDSRQRNLQDPSTDQFTAMKWLANDDPAALDFNETPHQEIKDRYRAALLYFAMNKGDGWRQNLRFLTAENICQWNDEGRGYAFEGIRCEKGEVTEITLDMNRLEGTIPTEIALFDLQSLGLGSNALSGTIPTEVGLMFNLRTLKLGSNRFEGTLPTELARLLSLKTLLLYNNKLEGSVPAEYISLVNLDHLYIEGTSLTGEVDSSFCGRRGKIKNFYANCDAGGEITCSCCTYCCNSAGTTCHGMI